MALSEFTYGQYAKNPVRADRRRLSAHSSPVGRVEWKGGILFPPFHAHKLTNRSVVYSPDLKRNHRPQKLRFDR